MKRELDPTRCRGSVWSNFTSYQCSRKPGDSGYCKTHDPEIKKAKDAERSAAWKAKWEAEKAEQRKKKHIADVTEEMVCFVRAIADGQVTCPSLSAERLVAKMDGGLS